MASSEVDVFDEPDETIFGLCKEAESIEESWATADDGCSVPDNASDLSRVHSCNILNTSQNMPDTSRNVTISSILVNDYNIPDSTCNSPDNSPNTFGNINNTPGSSRSTLEAVARPGCIQNPTSQQNTDDCEIIWLSSSEEVKPEPRPVPSPPRQATASADVPRARVWRASLMDNIRSSSRHPYTPQERRTMVKYLIENDAIRLGKGYCIWKNMRKNGILTHHTPQSLQNEFKRVILPSIEKFPGLHPYCLAQFREIQPLRDVRPNPYVNLQALL